MLFIIFSPSIQIMLQRKSERDSRISSCFVIVRMQNDESQLTIITSTDAMMEQILRIYGGQGTISPTFYEQLLRAQIDLKSAKKLLNLMVFLRFLRELRA